MSPTLVGCDSTLGEAELCRSPVVTHDMTTVSVFVRQGERYERR